MNYGMTSLIKKLTKRLIPYELRKMVKLFTVIKIMQKWMVKVNLLTNTRLHMPLCIILSQWTIY